MAIFNLKDTKGTATVRLQAWTINEVVYKGVEYKSGTSKTGNTWKAMQLKFAGENGIFEPLIFCPGEDGDKRKTGTTNGKDWELPSAMEQLALTIAHVGTVLAPANYEKLKTVSLDLPADFEKLVSLLSKALAPAENKKTHIKLIGDNRGYAALPNFININKDGDAYISNNWLGDNLAFSAYEMKTQKRLENAKPTEIKESIGESIDSADDNTDLDFNV